MVDGQCISIQDTIITPGSIEFATRGNRCHRDVIHTISTADKHGFSTPKFNYTSRILLFANATLMIWPAQDAESNPNMVITYLIVDQCTDLNALKSFICNYPDLMVILPAYIKPYARKVLISFCVEQNIKYWDISEQGYFKLLL